MRKFEKYLELSDRNCEVEEITKENVIGFIAGCEEAGEKRNSIILRLVILKSLSNKHAAGKH